MLQVRCHGPVMVYRRATTIFRTYRPEILWIANTKELRHDERLMQRSRPGPETSGIMLRSALAIWSGVAGYFCFANKLYILVNPHADLIVHVCIEKKTADKK